MVSMFAEPLAPSNYKMIYHHGVEIPMSFPASELTPRMVKVTAAGGKGY